MYYAIAGMGRCGTTLVFNQVREAVHNLNGTAPGGFKRYLYPPPANVTCNIHDACLHEDGRVYKTHDYPIGVLSSTNGRFIFMFGDPIDVILSAHYKTNTEEHYKNLHADPIYAQSLHFLYEDTMNIERLTKCWFTTSEISDNVLCVRYETLWDNLEKVNDFLGIVIDLPPQRPRTTSVSDYPQAHIEAMEHTYSDLIKLINDAPDIF